jgi:hypothetical protein
MAPLFFEFAGHLFPASLDTVPIHVEASFSIVD